MNGHKILDLPIAVDCFLQTHIRNVKLFFLTHMHSDHTHGLSSHWKFPIYCSEISGRLLHHKFQIPLRLINVLEENQPYFLKCDGYSINVVLLPANHCPGSCMFLFECPDSRILYTGDFRFDEGIPDVLKSSILGKPPINMLFLDNTYCEEGINFPPRQEATKLIIDICQKHPEHRILIGTSWIGHEKLLEDISLALDAFVFVDSSTMQKLSLLDVKDVFREGKSVRLNAVPNKELTLQNSTEWNKEMPTICIRPTAMFGSRIKQCGSSTELFYSVPFSNHCNYQELWDFVSFIKPCAIKPIVLGRTAKPGMSSIMRADMERFSSCLWSATADSTNPVDKPIGRPKNSNGLSKIFDRIEETHHQKPLRSLKKKKVGKKRMPKGVVFDEDNDCTVSQNLGNFIQNPHRLIAEVEREMLADASMLYAQFAQT